MREYIQLLFLVTLLVAVSVFGPPRLAAAETPSATGAFKRGDYPQALALFRQAEAAGNESDRLKFNLGVTLFKLGRYEEASEYFWQLVPAPQWRDLAEYNLGLVARRQGDQIQAAQYFRRVSARSASPKLQRLAALQLGAVASEPAPQPRPWLAMTSLNAGFDSNPYAVKNALLGEDAVGEDSFFELFAWGQYRLQGNERDGWRLHGYGFTRRYSDLDNLNLGSVSSALSRDMRWRGWALEAGAGAELVTLGGELVSRQLQFIGRAKRDFGATSVQLSYIPAYYAGGDDFTYLDGWRQRFSARAGREAFGADLSVYYLYDTNDRADLQQAAEDYYSYSPIRHAFGSDARWRFMSRWELRAGFEYRYSVYDGLNRVVDGEGNVAEYERASDRFRSWVSTRYRLTPRFSLDGKVTNIDNRENRDLYDYDKTEFSLGVSYVF
ncbi:tetratricopeptide repeat protein [uncultured Microbulbifer sp.]|uniref:tetratricopeptide repeat protein n=1 Tax=uncultured Microbulbifer sp. TaxID=348147 RepID=UPI0026387D9B|nr:tetratricopeptide repeat protein [uncultured Microbulbifer sp.]